jgi:hypothetical protein
MGKIKYAVSMLRIIKSSRDGYKNNIININGYLLRSMTVSTFKYGGS